MRHLATTLIIALVLLGALPAFCQTTYTSPTTFNAALTGFVGDETIGFDQQGDRTPAAGYGLLSISGRGLDSDGETRIALSTIATAAYMTVSGFNSLGVDFEDTSFLAGNGDSADFKFSSPVHAFGVYLIGNPSATGDPPIPFWRMRVTVTGGYDAYSATEPLFALPSGDDVYFLGVVSPVKSFTRATIYSDNDPDAVFSFTLDDLIYATAPGVVTIVQAKAVGAGSVTLSNVVVTRTHSDRFNVQTPDAPVGIAVLGGGASRGENVTLIGVATSTPDGERVIDLRQIVSGPPDICPRPLCMQTKAVGGSTTVGLQPGTCGAAGPNNIGIDAKICGKVTAMAPDWIVVDDGCGRKSGIWQADGTQVPGVKVVGPISHPALGIGAPVAVTGSISMYPCADGYYPLIRVAQSEDISVL